MTINKVQVEVRKGGIASVWRGVLALDKHEKMANYWFLLNK